MTNNTTKYFIYVRKSSEDEDRQALSIEAQLVELRDFARSQDLDVVKEYHESKTAKEPGRPIFNEMMAEIKKGNAGGIVAWNPDRLARNAVDSGTIVHYLDKGWISELKFATFTFENNAQGKFNLMISFGQAKYYVDNLSQNIRRGQRQKIRRGEYSGKAPQGYLNEPRLRTIVPDPRRFSVLQTELREFASGRHSLTSFHSKLRERGMRSANTGRELALSTVDMILRNPFYYGVCRYGGELYEGVHKPMISKAEFDSIQAVLQENGRPRRVVPEIRFQFLGYARCATCRHAITAEEHVKRSGLRFVYYHCSGRPPRKRCPDRKYLREERFASLIRDQAALVALPDVWKDRFLESIAAWEKEEQSRSSAHLDRLRERVRKIRAKLQRLMDVYLEGNLEIGEFQQTKNALVAEKVTVDQEIAQGMTATTRLLEPLKRWICEANSMELAVNSGNLPEMTRLLQRACSNWFLRSEIMSVEWKKPWNLLAETTLRTRSLRNDSERSRVWWSLVGSVRTRFASPEA